MNTAANGLPRLLHGKPMALPSCEELVFACLHCWDRVVTLRQNIPTDARISPVGRNLH